MADVAGRLEGHLVALADTLLAGGTPLALAVAVALLVGAAHGLLPGHGKLAAAAVVAAGGRATTAVTVGVAVAVSHTLTVVLLGTVWLAGSVTGGSATGGLLEAAAGFAVIAVGLRYRHTRRRGGHHHHSAHSSAVGVGLASGLLPSPAAVLALSTAALAGALGTGLLLVAAFAVGLASAVTIAGLAGDRLRWAAERAAGEARVRQALGGAAPWVVVAAGGLLVLRSVVGLR